MVRSITVTTLQLRIHRVFRDLTYFTNSVLQTYIRSYYSLSWSFFSFHGTRRFHDHAHNVPYPVPNKYNPHPHVPSPESKRSLCSDYATGGRPTGPGVSFKIGCTSLRASCSVRAAGPSTWGLDGRDLTLTTHLHLMPKLIMHGAVSPFPRMLPWLAQGQLYPYLRVLFVSYFNVIYPSTPVSRKWSRISSVLTK